MAKRKIKPRKATILKRWKEFLEAASKEVTFLNHYSEVRSQFNLIAGRSPVAETSSEFWDFAHRAFAHELIMRVCRLSEGQFRDKKKEVYSLKALLDEFLEHPEYLSREQYLGVSPVTLEEYNKKHPSRFNPTDPFMFNRLNQEFDEVAGQGSSHISKGMIEADITTLKKTTKRLQEYRNKKLAHISVKRGRFKNPKFSEIQRAIHAIDDFMRKYFLIFNSASHPLTFGNIDISEIFMQAWIPSEAARQDLVAMYTKSKQKRVGRKV